MNCKIYFFGNFGRGYDQYLFDYTKPILQNFAKRIDAPSQLCIHREKDLIYYGYIRRLEDNPEHFIGLCCVINGSGFCQFSELFKVFEKEMESIISQGIFVGFDNNGNIVPVAMQLSCFQNEINIISAHLKILLSELSFVQLSPYNYAVSSGSVNKLINTDSPTTITDSINNYSYTYIYKNSNFDTNAITSYRRVVRNLKSEIGGLQEEVVKLKDSNKRLEQEKKRTKLVAWLSTCLAILAFVFAIIWNHMSHTIVDQTNKIHSLNQQVSLLTNEKDSLNVELHNTIEVLTSTQIELKQKNNELDEKVSKIESLQENVSKLETKLSETKTKLENTEKQLELYKKNITNTSLVILDVSVANTNYNGDIETNYGSDLYSSTSMYIAPRISYYGLISGSKTIYIKLFYPNGELVTLMDNKSPKGYTNSYSRNISKGENTMVLNGLGGNKKGHWSAGKYKYEFYCDGKLIGTHEFTIH